MRIKLDKPANPLLGGEVDVPVPVPTCCGQAMQKTSTYDGDGRWAAYDCTHCKAMIDVEVSARQRHGCPRCGGRRCGSDDNHLGDDGGYLP